MKGKGWSKRMQYANIDMISVDSMGYVNERSGYIIYIGDPDTNNCRLCIVAHGHGS